MYMLFFSDSGRCCYSTYRFFYRFREMFLRPKSSILYSMYPIGIIYIYIYTLYYIYTRVFARICTTWRGKNLTAEMLVKTISKGTVLFAEMLVENNFKGEAFQLLKCLCKKQLEGGSIQTVERLVKKTISRGKHSNCWNAGRKTSIRNILTAEKLVKNNFKGEAF